MITAFNSFTENTCDVTVPNDNDGHNGGYNVNYHAQQQQWYQSSSNTLPVISYFTIVKSEENNMVHYQPTMEVHICTCCVCINALMCACHTLIFSNGDCTIRVH